jgi:hypothetical protein
MCCIHFCFDLGLSLTLTGLFIDMVGVVLLFLTYTKKPPRLWKTKVLLNLMKNVQKELIKDDGLSETLYERKIMISTMVESLNERESEIHEEILRVRNKSAWWIGLIILGFIFQFVGAILST